jgi:sugar phosphate isomerase/epimerase
LASQRICSVAEILSDYNISLALEFVGPETCRVGATAHGPTAYIHSLGQVLDFIEELDTPNDNVGLLLDSFHWYTSRGTIENLLMLTSDKVVHVHINDAPDVPINKQMNFERLLPGEGIIDLNGFLKTLAYIGYTGFVAVETFNRDLVSKGPERAAQLTEVAMERLLANL